MPFPNAGRRAVAALALCLLPAAAPAQPARATAAAAAAPAALPDRDWASYGGDPGGSRHSPLAQITRANVGRLAVAWRFRTGEADDARYRTRRRTSFEATPLVVGGTMYLSTPLGRVFALDAATGRERWRYNAGVTREADFGDFTSRGVSYWVDAAAAAGARCRARVVLATMDGRLIALDAADGAPCLGFGDGGTVDLRMGLRNDPESLSEYEVTSPPAVVGGTLVVGSAIADNGRTEAVSGEVRGYDARSGALRWTFDPVPQRPADPAYATWRAPAGAPDAHRAGAANAWSVIAADSALGLVYVPTSSPSVDYYGGTRLGDNRHANSLVAIRAATGEVAWSFQTVHHDLWDYDNASPPALVTVRRGGREVPAVLQATKTGMLYVLDRRSGAPVVPVEERPVPASDVPGEEAARTQPFSMLPPLSPHRVSPADANGADSADRAACRTTLAALRNEGIFTPPTLGGTLVTPGNIGGAHWGGVAFDPARQLAVVPVNTIAAVVQLLPRARWDEPHEPDWEYAYMRGTPYVMRRRFLISPKGVPCTPPPFGALVAVNVETGRVAWRVPLGTAAPLAASRSADAPPPGARPGAEPAAPAGTGTLTARRTTAAAPALGAPNLGGAIVTAGGVVFVGATVDRQFRAFDVESGRLLWQAPLPAGAKATPMTYAAGGRQYVAIAAGGDGNVFGRADELVVYALP